MLIVVQRCMHRHKVFKLSGKGTVIYFHLNEGGEVWSNKTRERTEAMHSNYFLFTCVCSVPTFEMKNQNQCYYVYEYTRRQ